MSKLAQDQRGIVFIEFLIAFTPFFLLFLGTVQLALLAQAHLVVQHAAVRAVRTAVITIDDDPYFYEGEARKRLVTRGAPKGDGSPAEGAMNKIMPGQGAATQVQRSEKSGGDRLQRVRTAAYLPLSVISPTHRYLARLIPFATSVGPGLDDRSLHAATGDKPLMRAATGFFVYGRVGAAVTFPRAPGASELRDTDAEDFGTSDAVTARVTFLYPCTVPVVRALVCRSALDMSGIPDAVRSTISAAREPSYTAIRNAFRRWNQQFPAEFAKFRQDLEELQKAEWPLLQLGMLAHLDEKFVVISKEATLPNHGAPYKYYSELSGDGSGGGQ